MRIIPVLDIADNQVVQGIQGDRARYKPVKSLLTANSKPLPIAQALQKATGCDTLYIADLDAIEGTGHHRPVLRTLSANVKAELWVDAGISEPGKVQAWYDAGVDRIVVGSETLSARDQLKALQAQNPQERLIFSLDVKQGRILSQSPELSTASSLDVLAYLSQHGWTHVILLTLDRVGTGSGPDWSLLERARRYFSHLQLFTGGGVRTSQDLQRLADLGIHGVLVASALHKGWITRRELQSLGP